MYLPEWVLRQFGYTQTIPSLLSQSANPLATRDQISAQYTQYLDRVLTPEQRGLAAIYAWYATPDYLRWYFQISHPYIRPLPPGDPPRPCEHEALIEEEAQSEGPIAISLTNRIKMIRAIANDMLLSGELPDGSHAQRDVQ
ncbi:putative IMP dehydrogenase/GMP reductase, partial [Trifolium medium]|nr:putative IMP dehydrogenase/GMP reductase [Trifolium medium]